MKLYFKKILIRFSITIICFSSIFSQCVGDLNDDYSVNIQDVIIIVNTILDNDEVNYEIADINNDQNVNIQDVIGIINIILFEDNPCTSQINITYNIHESLPEDWIIEFYIIIDNLISIIPANQNNFNNLNVYAWNSSVQDPYLGIEGGTYIGGGDEGFIMVLEINEMEFEWNHMHRLSVIAHEYFHIYQLSINEPMNEPNGQYNPNGFSIKWLIEGTATSFESLYVQDYYSYNYFNNDLVHTELSPLIHTDPSVFESYSSNNIDNNYTSSVFMVLVLVKELINQGFTENEAFRMIFKEFMQTGAKNSDWEIYFLDMFGFSVDDFYNVLQSYPLNLDGVFPSSLLSIEEIFN